MESLSGLHVGLVQAQDGVPCPKVVATVLAGCHPSSTNSFVDLPLLSSMLTSARLHQIFQLKNTAFLVSGRHNSTFLCVMAHFHGGDEKSSVNNVDPTVQNLQPKLSLGPSLFFKGRSRSLELSQAFQICECDRSNWPYTPTWTRWAR